MHEDWLGLVGVPLTGGVTSAQQPRVLAAPSAVLAQGDGLLAWKPAGSDRAPDWGAPLKGTSSFAQAVSAVLKDSGRGAAQAGETLFRLELPTGHTLNNLVPAIGGGYRGLTRAAGSTAISGHARLVPTTGAAIAGGAALGPVIALVAVSAGAEMLARHEQDKKLRAILRSVEALEANELTKLRSRLGAAQETLIRAHAALMDGVTIPESLGVGPAADSVRRVKYTALEWLGEWEGAAGDLKVGSEGVGWGELKKIFGKGLGGMDALPLRVGLLYQSLVLDARWNVLVQTEAAATNRERPLDHLDAALGQALEQGAALQHRLAEILWLFAENPIDTGFNPLPREWKRAAGMHTSLLAMVRAIHQASETLPVLTARGTQVLEGVLRPDGSVQLLTPGVSGTPSRGGKGDSHV